MEFKELKTKDKKELQNLLVVNREKLRELRFKDSNKQLKILEYGISQYRFYEAIYGSEAPPAYLGFGPAALPPDHLGYSNHTSFSETATIPEYFILTESGRHFYPDIYPEFKDKWRLTAGDFDRLKQDLGVAQIYSNGDMVVFLTNPPLKQA